MDSLLILDLHNTLYRSASVMPNLTYAGHFTGGLYGFINQFCRYVNLYRPKDILICSDKPPYFRSLDFPQYKQQRNRQRDPELKKKINETRQQILEFIDILQISFWEKEGLEADDLIAIACEQFHEDYEVIKILSNDDDLYQLLIYKNIILHKKKDPYTHKNFKKDFPNIPIEVWPKVLALSGSHNGVPGLKGVGLKTALKLIQDPESYQKIYNANKEILDLYEKIIRLPYIYIREDLIKFKYDERKMIKLLSKYNITLTQGMRQAFNHLAGE